jgi:hypothetical protein
MTHVDQVDSIAVGASWIRAGDGKCLDEVEEALVAIPSGRKGCTSGGVIAAVLCTASVSNLLAVVVGKDRRAPLRDQTLAVGHCVNLSAQSLEIPSKSLNHD